MRCRELLIGGTVAVLSTGAAAFCAPDAPGACTDMLLQSTVTWDGAPMKYLRTRHPELTIRTIQFSPGTYNAPHIHEAPVYIYVMTGAFEVILADGRSQTWYAGEAFNEVMNTVHRGGNPGTTFTKLVIMSPSMEDCPFMTLVTTLQSDGPQCKEDDWRDPRNWSRNGFGQWFWH